MDHIRPEVRLQYEKEIGPKLDNIRNKLKKWADKVIVSTYVPEKKEEVLEGQTWEENGKTWTIKNGIKMTIRKTEGAATPWWCPRCKGSLSHKLQDKFYKKKGACFNCWIEFEGKMRVAGVYPAFERRTLRDNERGWIKDQIEIHLDFIKNQKSQLVFADGRFEDFVDKSAFTPMFDKLKKDIDLLETRLDQLQKDEDDDAAEQGQLREWEQLNPWN